MKLPKLNLSDLVNRRPWQSGLLATLVVGGFFRLWKLGTLAPGLGQDEAQTAVRALALSSRPTLAVFSEAQSFGTSLFISLQAIFVRLFGNTVLGIRLLPALLGVAAVLFVYLWLSNWFSKRVGLIAAMLFAVTPWVITASRRGDIHSLSLFVIPCSLWLFTRALQSGSSWRYLAGGLVMGLGLTADMGSFMPVIALLMISGYLIVRRRDFASFTGKGFVFGLAGLMIPLALTAIAHLGSPAQLAQAALPDINIAQQSAAHRVTSVTKTILMFNVRGDENFSNNVGSVPMLNFFVGLMLVMGLLVSLSRIHRARYGALLALVVICLIPAMLSPYTPDARAALAAAPFVLALAAIGVSYLLDVWYSTFPVNSAARAVGTVPIIFLLTVTLYQGYKQYFVAWAGSPEVYEVYNEPADAIADWLNRTTYAGERYVAVNQYGRNVLDYITHGRSAYSAISHSDLASIPTEGDGKQIIIASKEAGDAVKTLKDRFPKARLSQHYSKHNDNNELFIVFEVLK